MKYETKDYIVKYNDSEHTKELVYQKILDYFKRHEAFRGEVIMQSDEATIDAPEVLALLADEVFCFNVTYKD